MDIGTYQIIVQRCGWGVVLQDVHESPELFCNPALQKSASPRQIQGGIGVDFAKNTKQWCCSWPLHGAEGPAQFHFPVELVQDVQAREKV